MEIVNKVAQSGLIELNLEEFYLEGERVLFDIKPLLFQELVLKERDFRSYVKEHDWSQYENKYVAITCTSDAIVPTWAYMLVASSLVPFAKATVFGSLEVLETVLFEKALNNINPEEYTDKRIVVKGCSNKPVPTNAYLKVLTLLQPFAKSIMYGEPCSTVPLYKKKASA